MSPRWSSQPDSSSWALVELPPYHYGAIFEKPVVA
jgi:hypothetical protein